MRGRLRRQSAASTARELCGGLVQDGNLNALERLIPRDAPAWHDAARRAAAEACATYQLHRSWTSPLSDCVLGIIAVESRYGRSRRFHAKRLLQGATRRSPLLSRLAPAAQGIAQIDKGRVAYLRRDAGLGAGIDARDRYGAIRLTALGLAKAAAIHYSFRRLEPVDEELAILIITHNAGWMVPRVARLQDVLVSLGFLSSQTPRSGAVGPSTLAALDRAAHLFGCATIRDVWPASRLSRPPAWGLTDPDLAWIVYQSDLFHHLQHAAIGIGESLCEPMFPLYRFRRWYTGWISSEGYARAALAHAHVWRMRSITRRGGPPSSKAR